VISNQEHVKVPELDFEKQRWIGISQYLREICDGKKITYNFRDPQNLHKNTFDKIFLVCLFDSFSLQAYNDLVVLAEKFNKKIYVLVDSWIDDKLFQDKHVMVFSEPKLFSLSMTPTMPKLPCAYDKLYNAFIHRAEPVRQSWFYFLFLRDLLHKGYVSYNLYQINSRSPAQDLFDEIHKSGLDSVEHFNYAYESLKSQVPFCNFHETGELSSYISKTKYSLVLDTYAPDDDTGCYYISEKIIRALQHSTVNLFFLQKHTLSKMSKAGLYIDPLMLEIDKMDWQSRQQQILDLLANDMINDLDHQRYEQSRHNCDILNTWLLEVTEPVFYQNIIDTIAAD
jgi:hypothetical protein